MEHKIVSHIDCPKEWMAIDDYGSHLPVLWMCLTSGENILDYTCGLTEMGCGLKSTPMLADLMNKQERVFEFFDTDKEWFDKVEEKLNLMGLFPDGKVVKSCLDVESVEAILFVDCKPGEDRKPIIEKYANDCAVIIVHDTEPYAQRVYGIENVLNSFKYRLDYQPDKLPHTTVLSNFVDVTKFVE